MPEENGASAVAHIPSSAEADNRVVSRLEKNHWFGSAATSQELVFYAPGNPLPVFRTFNVSLFKPFEKELSKLLSEIFARTRCDQSGFFKKVEFNGGDAQAISMLLKDLNVTTREKLYIIFCFDRFAQMGFLNTGNADMVQMALVVARGHYEKLRDKDLSGSHVDDSVPYSAEGILDPIISQYGDKELIFMKNFSFSFSFLQLLSNPELRKVTRNIYSKFFGLNQSEEEITYYYTSEVFQTVEALSCYPIHSLDYIKRIASISISDFQYMQRLIPSDIPIENAIELTDSIVQGRKGVSTNFGKKENFKKSHELIEVIVDKCEEEFYQHTVKKAFDEIYGAGTKSPVHTSLMIDYFKDARVRVETFDRAASYMTKTGAKSSLPWIEFSDHSEYVLKKLLQKSDAYAIVETIMDVMDLGKTLSLKYWLEYLENFDLYSTCPAAWWVAIVEDIE